MKLPEFEFLADENFDPDVVAHFREHGWRIVSVHDAGLAGKPDLVVLDAAWSSRRVLLTHDSDFGELAVTASRPLVGVIYIRPGHIESVHTIETINALVRANPDLVPPFIVVASRRNGDVNIRVRQM